MCYRMSQMADINLWKSAAHGKENMDISVYRNWQGRIRRRSERQAERFRRRYQIEHRLYHIIREDAADILRSSNFRRTRQHVQHGTMTVNSHCMDVAKCSLYLSEKLAKLHIRCNRRELIRGHCCMIIFSMIGMTRIMCRYTIFMDFIIQESP